MKIITRRLILISSLLGLVAPAHAMTYLDAKFKNALEQALVPWGKEKKKTIAMIDESLENGANVNLMIAGQTPAMLVVNAIVKKAKLGAETQEKLGNGGMAEMGVFSLALLNTLILAAASDRYYGPPSGPGILFSVINGLVALGLLCNFVKKIPNILRIFTLYADIQADMAILRMLLKHPSVDLTLKNNEGKTIFKVVEDYWKERTQVLDNLKAAGITVEAYVKRRDLESLQKIGELLQAKQQGKSS